MANLTGGTIANANTEFNLAQPSMEITVDTFDTPWFKILSKYGVITDLSIRASKSKGDTVKVPNVYRLNSQGNVPTQSSYSQAKTLEYGSRSLVLKQYKDTFQYDRPETLSSQRDTFDLLGKHEQRLLSDHMKGMVMFGIFQHLGGNTATSYYNPACSDSAFTGSTLNNSRLLTSTVAPSTEYYAFGSLNSASHSDASTINATNTRLTMQDIQAASVAIDNHYRGIPKWQRLKTMEAQALLWVSQTGFNQLINQARASNADTTVSELRYALLQGGKSLKEFDGVNMTHLPGVNMLMIVVPDTWMPRASASGTENSTSRLAIITGGGALDFAIGNAMPSGDMPSYLIRVDDKTFSLDDKIHIGLTAILAGQKARLAGFGTNSGNTYDAATFVIAHSAAA